MIRLRIGKAKRVELSGEPTSWTPISMKRADDDWWEVTVNARPGSYRVNVRIDGREWIAPPGTVPSRDEFGGEAGVIQIR
jgi:1,4-alpha-glucan branching enzyme